MDALVYWIAALAIGSFAGGVYWLWQDGKKEQARRLEADIERLTTANQKKDAINEAQASPFPDASFANKWLRKQRNGNK